MKFKNSLLKLVFLISVALIQHNFSEAQDSCCHPPDSLKVVLLTATNFCVSWHTNDSTMCDSAIGAVLQYRPVGFRFWITANIIYYPGTHTYTYCDSAFPCTNYEWQVKTICGDSNNVHYTSFVTGPGFKTLCPTDFSSRSIKNNPLCFLIIPNPATNQVMIVTDESTVQKSLISITDATGIKYYQEQRVLENKRSNILIDISRLKPGLYFIKLESSKAVSVKSFIKT